MYWLRHGFLVAGSSVSNVLALLRNMDSSAFKDLEGQYLKYASCVGMVNTGYFKRQSMAVEQNERTVKNTYFLL